MLELPPEISRKMAEAIQADRHLGGGTANEKWSFAYAIVSQLEELMNSEDGFEDFPCDKLARKVTRYFKGLDRAAKVANALTAVNRAKRLYDDYEQEHPYGQCNFEDFLTRYRLTAQEPVPFPEGVKIITGEEQSQHLGRARRKFDKLVALLAAEREESGRRHAAERRAALGDEDEDEDEPHLPLRRRVPGSRPNGQEVDGRIFYSRSDPDNYPKPPVEIPEGYSFRARDVHELWKDAIRLKVWRRHRKIFSAAKKID
jgi:hypothetical protein